MIPVTNCPAPTGMDCRVVNTSIITASYLDNPPVEPVCILVFKYNGDSTQFNTAIKWRIANTMDPTLFPGTTAIVDPSDDAF